MAPVYIGITFLDWKLYGAWTSLATYVCLLAILFRWRFKTGKWKKMRVIEPHPAPVVQPGGVPTVERPE